MRFAYSINRREIRTNLYRVGTHNSRRGALVCLALNELGPASRKRLDEKGKGKDRDKSDEIVG